MRLLLLTAIILGFHSLSQANQITASIVTKQNDQLVMVSESHLKDEVASSNLEWSLNQVPFNSLKNLQIKGTFMGAERAILVFDINETVTSPENGVAGLQTHVLTAQEKLVAAEIDPATGMVKVQILESGEVKTITVIPENAASVGLVNQMSAQLAGKELLWSADGQIFTTDGQKIGRVMTEGVVVTMVTDLNKKIATLTGSGSEIVITGEKKEFLASMDQLQDLNAQQKQNPEWVPVTDLKISNLSSVLQIEFRNSTEEESFTVFKLVSPLVVSQIKENQAKN
ncbi:MAG: hypothetical protein V4654_09285 [Bdellovibrionota bacterium]